MTEESLSTIFVFCSIILFLLVIVSIVPFLISSYAILTFAGFNSSIISVTIVSSILGLAILLYTVMALWKM